MKSLHIVATVLTLLLCTSCNGNGENNGNKTDADIWAHQKPLVAKVEVSSGGGVIESFEYTYDDKDRLLTLVKRDNLSGEVTLDLQYSYPGENQVKIIGIFSPISTKRYIIASYDPKSSSLTYNGSWSGAWTYTTCHDENRIATRTECNTKFASKDGYYTSDMIYSEEYTVSGGTVVQAVAGTDIKAQSSKTTNTANSSVLTTVYTPGDQADRQNFAAYLMPNYFPVWIAAGFPGNKKLIKSIGGATGTIPAPETTTIEYSLNSAGDIDTAVRTDFNAGEPILVLTYKFTYL